MRSNRSKDMQMQKCWCQVFWEFGDYEHMTQLANG